MVVSTGACSSDMVVVDYRERQKEMESDSRRDNTEQQ